MPTKSTGPVPSGGLMLVDGSALAYRSHFAMTSSGLSRADGTPTGATYGFAMELHRLLERIRPTHAAVVFDSAEPTFRHALYADYKATRERMPEELVAQLDLLRQVCAAEGVPALAKPGFEADDVMGTLAVQARDAQLDCWLVTGDKDFLQLVDDRIRVYQLPRGDQDAIVIDRAGVREKFGVAPEQVVDVLALMGDASDNAPGVPGIGEKTAIKLIQDFGNLDAVLEGGPTQSPKVRAALQSNRELAHLTKRLVTIETHCPLDQTLDDLKFSGGNAAVAGPLYRELEFRSLAQAFAEAPRRAHAGYVQVKTADELEAVLREVEAAELVSVDTETTSLDPRQARLVGVSFSVKTGEAWYIPMNADPPVVPDKRDAPFRGYAVLERLRPFLESSRPTKCGQNAKYDMLVLRGHGVRVAGLRMDTMLAAYLVDPGAREHGLDALSLRYFGYQKIRTEELIGTGKNQITMDLVPVDAVAEYAAEDADYTRRLAELFGPELDQKQLRRLHDEVELPLLYVLADMEEVGVRVDRSLLKKMAATLLENAERLGDEIRAIAGPGFNPNSPKQLGEFLFETLKVHEPIGYKPKKTKTGWATGQEVLEELGDVEICRKILEYRSVTKLVGTYVQPLPDLVGSDGRIHTSYNQAVAATGRLSSSNPNLQNIPIRTEAGKKIRLAFLPTADDWVLLSADYSQIELRLLAHFAQDDALISAFVAGRDIHRETAARVFGITPDAVDPATRSRAKAINFGILYGMGPQRLARETGLTVDEARQFIDRYFAAFPKVRGFLDGLKAKAREDGFVTTILGRRRTITDINSPNGMLRAQAENMAVNTPIQGSAADLIKVAMINIHRELGSRHLQARLILQVHDELVLDVPTSELPDVQELVRAGMETVWDLRVPLRVDMGTGRNWLEAH